MTYAKQLKLLMSQKEITQQQLSDLTGIGKSSISQYVSGRNEPSKVNREKIQSVLGEFEIIETEDVTTTKNNLPVTVAAKRMGVSPEFIRVGLQNGILDFGYAVKISSRYTYHISPKKFAEYVGG